MATTHTKTDDAKALATVPPPNKARPFIIAEEYFHSIYASRNFEASCFNSVNSPKGTPCSPHASLERALVQTSPLYPSNFASKSAGFLGVNKLTGTLPAQKRVSLDYAKPFLIPGEQQDSITSFSLLKPVKCSNYDIVSAVKRQSPFFYQRHKDVLLRARCILCEYAGWIEMPLPDL
ncbi:hypothetical protein FXO38_25353 [Capsicum annuum]|nr:hypothetical protein FXO38_25353 [Capsicum annuum]KAF3635921.1 hypothetical protein FXO37_25723 [Capsicum annuum]